MKINIRGNRIWLPKRMQIKLSDSFIEIELKEGNKKQGFLTKLTKDGRFVIPKDIRNYLKLKFNDEIQIRVKKILNKKRGKRFTKNNKFDMLSFIPVKTMSGFDILVLEEENKLQLWYSTKGRPGEIIINRFLPFEFSRLLGYYQAEGGKLKLNKRRGRDLSFTNKSAGMIEDFIALSKNLFDLKLWNATIRYNPNVNKKELNRVKSLLIKFGLNSKKIKLKAADRIANYTIRLWISNSILAEVIFNTSNKIRKYLIRLKLDSVNKIIYMNYLQGLLAGDGNFRLWVDSKGSHHSRIQIFEGKLDYVNDYKLLLEKLDIKGGIRKDKIKNLYTFDKYTNWSDLLKIFDLNLLSYSSLHQSHLIKAILNHKKYRALKYLIRLPKTFSKDYFMKINKLNRLYANSWLRDRVEEKLLERIGNDKWVLTSEAENIKNILSKI